MQKEFDKSNGFEKEKGFTLIEALVGMALMLMCIVGPLAATIDGIKLITQNKNRLAASYLAEEMVENFRNYRDTFAIQCRNFNPDIQNGSLVINSSYCGTSPNTISFPQNTELSDGPDIIAWKMFLNTIGLDIQQSTSFDISNGQLDSKSFKYTNQKPQSLSRCSDTYKFLYLNSDGYNCSFASGSPTQFKRKVTLTKVSPTSIKVEVSVTYNTSYLYGVSDKSVNVIDYIYMR